MKASVAVNYHSHPDAAQEVVAEIERSGAKAFAFQADVGKADEAKIANHVLMAETVKLKIEYLFKDERYDGVPIKNEISACVHLVSRIPEVDAKPARATPVQVEIYYLGIVKGGRASEPSEQFGTAGDIGVDGFDFIHALSRAVCAARPFTYISCRARAARSKCPAAHG